jgi:hypothetical protein
MLREVVLGMTVFGPLQELQAKMLNHEHALMVVAFGEFVGLKVFPPFYTLRLLPYAVPHVKTWERRLLRERDITDQAGGVC